MPALVPKDSPVLCNLPENPEPPGARVGYLNTIDNIRLRYAIWPRTGETRRGTICLVHGRTEFIEKYFETIEDFRKRGFCVATFDWRGQGGSQRLIRNTRLGFVESFDDYITDLNSFHARQLLPECPLPFYLVGHSMGALAALMAAARDRLMFDRLFLTSPMLSIPSLPISVNGVALVTEGLAFAGLGALPAGRKGDGEPTEENFPGNPLTSDHRRYMRVPKIYAERPDLIVGAPTIRWAAAAFRAMSRAAMDDFAARISVPVFMLGAANDRVVSTSAIEQLGLRMRTGRHAVLAKARHELFVESNPIRDRVLAAFDAFVTEKSEI